MQKLSETPNPSQPSCPFTLDDGFRSSWSDDRILVCTGLHSPTRWICFAFSLCGGLGGVSNLTCCSFSVNFFFFSGIVSHCSTWSCWNSSCQMTSPLTSSHLSARAFLIVCISSMDSSDSGGCTSRIPRRAFLMDQIKQLPSPGTLKTPMWLLSHLFLKESQASIS